MLKQICYGEKGQSLTEYGLILALVSFILVGALTALKDVFLALYNQLNAGIPK